MTANDRTANRVERQSGVLPRRNAPVTIDLNVAAARTEMWNVEESNRISVDMKLESGAWGAAVVKVQGSVGGETWSDIATRSAEGVDIAINCAGYVWVSAIVTTPAGGAGVARLHTYSYVDRP